MSTSQHILVLHGALGAAPQLQPVADALSALGTVHLLELPGHGATPLRDDQTFSIDGFADAIAEYVAANVPTRHRPFCFGYSMGGYVALTLETRAPGTFAGIATLGSKFDWSPEIARRETAKLHADTIRAKVPRFAEALAARHAEAGGWELLLTRTAVLLTALGESPTLTEQSLRRVRAATHLAVGARDDTVTSEETARVASWCSGQSRVLDDVPHPIERVPSDQIVSLVQSLARTHS